MSDNSGQHQKSSGWTFPNKMWKWQIWYYCKCFACFCPLTIQCYHVAVFWAMSRSPTAMSYISVLKTTASLEMIGSLASRSCSCETSPKEAAVHASVRWPSASASMRLDGLSFEYFHSELATTSQRNLSSSSQNVGIPKTLLNTRSEMLPAAEAVVSRDLHMCCSDALLISVVQRVIWVLFWHVMLQTAVLVCIHCHPLGYLKK